MPTKPPFGPVFVRTRSPRRQAGRLQPASDALLEPLEARRHLAIVTWDGGAGTGAWFDAANWSSNTLPGAADDVVIPATPTLEITLSAATATTVPVRSINLNDAFRLAPAVTLQVATTLTLGAGSFTLAGGTLSGATIVNDFATASRLTFAGNTSSRLIGVTIPHDLIVPAGATVRLDATTTIPAVQNLRIQSSTVWIDEGFALPNRVQMESASGVPRLGPSGPFEMVIPASVTITCLGAGNIGGSLTNGNAPVTNRGTIVTGAASSQIQLNIDPAGTAVFTNAGTLSVTSPISVVMSDFRQDGGTISVTGAGARLRLLGNGYTVPSFAPAVPAALEFVGSFTIPATTAITLLAGSSLVLGDASAWTNLGSVSATNSTITLTADSAGANLWTNPGQIALSGCTTVLGGTFAASDLGHISFSGGTVTMSGRLINTGATFSLTPAMGTWTMNSGRITGGIVNIPAPARLRFSTTNFSLLDNLLWVGDFVLDSGQVDWITGSVLSPGAKFILRGSNTTQLSFENSGAAFGAPISLIADVEFDSTATFGPIISAPNTTLIIPAGTTVTGGSGQLSTATMNRGVIRTTRNGVLKINAAPLGFNDEGQIRLSSGGIEISNLAGYVGGVIVYDTPAALTLSSSFSTVFSVPSLNVPSGAGLSIAGTFTVPASSTITATGAQVTFNSAASTIPGWVNFGTLNFTNSTFRTLTTSTSTFWRNAGTITGVDSTIELGGTMRTADLGVIRRTRGTVRITGTLTNSGSTLVLDDASGPWILAGGTIRGGAISQRGSAQLLAEGTSGNTLDGVSMDSDLVLSDVGGSQSLLSLVNSFTLAPGRRIRLEGAFAKILRMSVDGGLGSFPLTTDIQLSTAAASTLGGRFTIQPGVTVQGRNFNVGESTQPIINRGTIRAQGPGPGTVAIGSAGFPSAVTNQGLIEVETGGSAVAVMASVVDTATRTVTSGRYRVAAGGSLSLSGSAAGPIEAIGAAATVELSGPGAAIANMGTLRSNAGILRLSNGATPTFTPSGGTFTNSGEITLDSVSMLRVGASGVGTGNFTQTGAGRLNVELAGGAAATTFAFVSADGAANLDGTLAVTRSSSAYAPAAGTQFQIIRAGASQGAFANVVLPGYLGLPGFAGVSYNALSGAALTIGPRTLDINGDGSLDADDLGDFITEFFSTGPHGPFADFNGDGEINADDLGDFITAYFAG